MAANDTTQPPIRTAVLGYGLAGRVFHCPFISAVPGLELTAIVQRRGSEAQDAYPTAQIARDVEEVFSDPNIDLIVIGTPNDTHFALAKRSLEAGKHCVVDKPFAATSAEAAELVELSQRTGKLVVPFHNRRFDGDFLTMQELVSEGQLGAIVEITSRFDRFRPAPRQNSWKEAPGPMSGLLFDLGSHLIDQALALFGTPETISAAIYRDREGTEIDDAFEIVLGYHNGAMRYRCGSSLMAAEPAPRFRANGTQGSFVKYGVDPQEGTVGTGTRPPKLGTSEVWLAEPEAAWGKLTLADPNDSRAPLQAKPHRTLAGDYRLFYANVRDAINGSADLLLRPQDGYRCIRMLEYAIQSSDEQRTIPVAL